MKVLITLGYQHVVLDFPDENELAGRMLAAFLAAKSVTREYDGSDQHWVLGNDAIKFEQVTGKPLTKEQFEKRKQKNKKDEN